MIDISILVPTRERPGNILGFLESMRYTAYLPETIEVVIYIDNDDPTRNIIPSAFPPLEIKKIIGPRSKSIGKMFKAMWKAASGRIIGGAGDDMVFRSQGWDMKIRDIFEVDEDGIYLAYGNDLHQGENMCTMPFLSSEYCRILGGVCPEEYPGEYADTHILDIFAKLKTAGYDRKRYLDKMIIEHIHPAAGKGEWDETYENRHPTSDSKKIYDSLEGRRKKEVVKLIQHIKAQEEL